MATKNAESTVENFNLLEKQNDVASAQCTTAAVTEAPGAVAEQTTTSESRRSSEEQQTNTSAVLPLLDDEAPVTTMSIDENESAASIGAAAAVSSAGGSARSSSSGGGGGGAGLKRRSSYGDKCNNKRKTRRGKTKRGKRSSSARPYSKTQWKFQVPWTTANRRRAEAALGSIVLPKAPILLSDQPPLVPYNTNRFLMEDHMPHVLTPSEDEEEFLTKEFSSVYEDARSERLESLTKSQLIQEYLQLEANYEQITRRYNAVKSLSIREENESAVNNATTTTTTTTTTNSMTKDDGSSVERRRLEERVRELTAENLDLRRQLEHAARIGMVLSAKSSPRNTSNNGPTAIEPMDSLSFCSEDSESDSSSSSSSDSSNDNDEDNDSSSSDCSLTQPPSMHNAQEAQQTAEQQEQQPMNAVDEEEEDLEGELLDALKENGYHVHVFSPQREEEDSSDVSFPPCSDKASSSVFF